MDIHVTRQDLRAVVDGFQYSERVEETAILSYCHPNPIIRRFFWSRIPCALKLLAQQHADVVWDFGSGTGVLLPFLSRFAKSVYASDLFPDPARVMVDKKGLGNVSVLRGPVPEPDEMGDGTVDAVIALDVLEHVEDLPGTAKLFHDKLKAGGRVIVSGPTESWFYKVGRWVAGFAGKEAYHHTNIYEIRKAFESAGFLPIRQTRLPPWPLPSLFYVYAFQRLSTGR